MSEELTPIEEQNAEESIGLSGLALHHPRAATVVFAGIVLMGVLAYLMTPRFESPQVIAPGFTVTTVYPGAEPEKVEELVTKRLEDVFQELDDVEWMEGYTGRSVSYLGCKCFDDTDMRPVLEKVHKKIAEASRLFPPEVRRPEIMEFSTADIPILIYALSGDFTTRQFRAFTERMESRLELVDAVSQIIVEGVEKDEVEVKLDPALLRQYRLDVLNVSKALGARNINVPGGAMKFQTGKYLVTATNTFRSLEDIRRTVVGFSGATPIMIKDIASVRIKPKTLNYKVRFNRSRAVTVQVIMKGGADIFRVTAGCDKVIAELKREFPPDLVIESVSRQRDSVEKVVNTFESNLFAGSLLVGAIILFHMGLRSSLVVLSAIPLSILLALMIMSFVGMKYHKISIFSLVLVLGMMVDNGIVMTENIFRRLEEEEGDETDIILRAANQVATPLLSSTLTTIAAFIPLWMMGGMTGKYIQALPQTVVIALFSSLTTAVFFTPLLAHWVVKTMGLPATEDEEEPEWLQSLHSYYRDKCHWMLNHKALVLGCSLIIFFLSIKVIPLLGLEFFPNADRGQFLIDLLMPAKYGIEASDEGARELEKILVDAEGIKHYLVYVGKGVPRFHYNIYRRELATYCSFLVTADKGYAVSDMIEKLRESTSRMPGCKITFQEVKEGPKQGMPISCRILGDDYGKVIGVSYKLEEQLKTIPGVVDIERDDFEEVPSLKVRIDEVKSRLLGIDGANLSKIIRAAVEGLEVTTFTRKGRELDVVVRLFEEKGANIERLKALEVPTAAGAFVPLEHIAELEIDAHVSIRYRRHARPSLRVRGRVDRVLPSTVLEKLKSMPKDFIPPGYVVEYGGENEGRDKSFRRLAKAMAASLAMVFLILVAQFKSFLQPLVVLFCLPLSIIGAVMGLAVTGYPFGFMAFLGFVALSGIVVNDAILLFDYINLLRQQGMEDREAIIKAAIVRHRAIYLTTITTMLGLLPLAITGGPLWAPLAWVIVFGIAMSTFLTLIVIPVGYALVEWI